MRLIWNRITASSFSWSNNYACRFAFSVEFDEMFSSRSVSFSRSYVTCQRGLITALRYSYRLPTHLLIRWAELQRRSFRSRSFRSDL
jgi:hypothetical protein